MKSGYIHTTYFGPISWYREFVKLGRGVDALDDKENYVKQTTRNHCCIATAHGVQKLTVPVSHSSSPTLDNPPLITEIRISEHGKWRNEHWNALCTAYGESPFFDYYADDLRPFFERHDWEFLFDFNQAILKKMLELLGVQGVQSVQGVRGVQEIKPYWQVYQQRYGFQPDLSILDLLFCTGNEAVLYL